MNATTTNPTISNSSESLGSFGFVDPIPQAVFESNDERRTLVIGDIHGHLDRFEALLRQEGLLVQCDHCEGLGTIYEARYDCENEFGDRVEHYIECGNCDGDGWVRIRRDEVEVVLLGDVAHFGTDGSPTGDILTWRAATLWADVILWGNHDRAAVDEQHAHRGYSRPHPEAFHWLVSARARRLVKLAYSAHGFLLTHAGLVAAFRGQRIPDVLKSDPVALATWLNEQDELEFAGHQTDPQFTAIRDAIPKKRGGKAPAGGILWRDIDEKLYTGFRQVFGHSASSQHVVRYAYGDWFTGKPGVAKADPSYCIDVGGKGNKTGDNCLAGIYLPDETIVRVDL